MCACTLTSLFDLLGPSIRSAFPFTIALSFSLHAGLLPGGRAIEWCTAEARNVVDGDAASCANPPVHRESAILHPQASRRPGKVCKASRCNHDMRVSTRGPEQRCAGCGGLWPSETTVVALLFLPETPHWACCCRGPALCAPSLPKLWRTVHLTGTCLCVDIFRGSSPCRHLHSPNCTSLHCLSALHTAQLHWYNISNLSGARSTSLRRFQ